MDERPGLIRRLHHWGVRHPKWYYIGPVSAWAVIVYVTSLMPPDKLRRLPAFPGSDKFEHAAAYALLAMLILRGWQREKMPPLGLHGFVWLLCLVYGAMIEVMQELTGYRSFDLLDIASNAAGALLGQIAWHAMMMKWGKRTRLYPGLMRPGFKDSEANRNRRE